MAPQGQTQQLPDTICDFGTIGPGRPFILPESAPMGLSPLLPSSGLTGSSGITLDPMVSAERTSIPTSCGPYLFHQTPSGSTLCQLGTTDAVMCSPTSSQSGSHPRLVHLSGGANDSGLSSLSGGFAPTAVGLPHPHNFSPEVRGELEELEPIPRDRCNTWPLRRAMGLEGQTQTSPLIHDRIPEEDSVYDDDEENCVDATCQQRISATDSSGTLNDTGSSPQAYQCYPPEQINSDERSDSAFGGDCLSRTDSPPLSGAKKSSTRRNAWGNMSYADLITQAILASPEKRLTLSQVYEWMVQNVPYFRDKGDSNSSAGWKNSIRHNLSLHSRFMRIQNEGAGKSSWWVINPDAKPGRNPRRRASTMENASKAAMDKKRRGARRRMEQLIQQKDQSVPSSSLASMQELFSAAEMSAEQVEQMAGSGACNGGPGGNFETFRPRAQSTLSVTGAHLSPKIESTGFEDFDFPSWMDQQPSQPTPLAQQQTQQQAATVNPQVNELLDRTDQMRLDMRVQQQQQQPGAINDVKMELQSLATTTSSTTTTTIGNGAGGSLLIPKTEIAAMEQQIQQRKSSQAPSKQPVIKQEVGAIPPPPSYQELSAVRHPAQLQTNSLLRQLGASPRMMSPVKIGGVSLNGMAPQPAQPLPVFTTGQQMFGLGNFHWDGGPPTPIGAATSSGTTPPLLPQQQQQFINGIAALGSNNDIALPMDLENVNAMSLDQSMFAGLDVDAVLRHELSQGGQFDLP